MSEYLYECHLHTAVASKCGRITPEEVVRLYTAMGYAGVFITDHFLNGNSAIDKSLPWKEKIDLYADSYRQVKKAAEGSGLDVFFGVEYHTGNAAEFLLYGITPEWLYEHEEIMDMSPRKVLEFFRENGILVYQAHPMRMRGYVPFISLFPDCVDGIEVYNVGNEPIANDFAQDYARRYNLQTICGSDLHRITQGTAAAFVSPIRLTEPKDIKKALDMGGTGMRIMQNPFVEKTE